MLFTVLNLSFHSLFKKSRSQLWQKQQSSNDKLIPFKTKQIIYISLSSSESQHSHKLQVKRPVALSLASWTAKLNNWSYFHWLSGQEMWSRGSITDSLSFMSLVFLSSDMTLLHVSEFVCVWVISQMSYECGNVSTYSWINIGRQWNA